MENANPVSHKLSAKDLRRTGADSSSNGHTTKVAKFVAHMQGKKADSLISSKSLGSHSVALASPLGTAPASVKGTGADADPRATALGKELKELAEAIEAGKSKISIGAKFLTRIKSWFPRSDSYDTAIAKQAFSKIDVSKQPVLLALAFEAAVSPDMGNSGDVQTVLNFCQAAGVKENAIVESINTIPDLHSRDEVLEELSISGFKWDGLQTLHSGSAKDLALNPAVDGPSQEQPVTTSSLSKEEEAIPESPQEASEVAPEVLQVSDTAEIDDAQPSQEQPVMTSSLSKEKEAIPESSQEASEVAPEVLQVSDTAEIDDAQPSQEQPVTTGIDLVICDPKSEAHRKRMEGNLAASDDIIDPRCFTRPHAYRRHLNAELQAQGSPFLLGKRFFDTSAVGREWREDEGKIPVTQEDMDSVEASDLSPEERERAQEEAALAREIGILWPGFNLRSVPFAGFVFGQYGRTEGRRYDLISDEERKLLKNIVLKAKAFSAKVEELQKRIQDEGPDKADLEEQISSLQNVLATIETTVRDNENACHVRLQEILRTCAETIDGVGNDSADVNSSEAMTKHIVSEFRRQVCREVLDPDNGSFFHEKHSATLDGRVQEVDFQVPLTERSIRAGKDLEIRQGAMLAMADAWALNNTKTTPHELCSYIGFFQFKDFIHPFIKRLRLTPSTEGGFSLATAAQKVFERVSSETLGSMREEYLKAEISFEDYCALLGKDATECRNNLAAACEKGIMELGVLNEGIRTNAAAIGFQYPEAEKYALQEGLKNPEILNEILSNQGALDKISNTYPASRSKLQSGNEKIRRAALAQLLKQEKVLSEVEQLCPGIKARAIAIGKGNKLVIDFAAIKGMQNDQDISKRAREAGMQNPKAQILMNWCSGSNRASLSVREVVECATELGLQDNEVLLRLASRTPKDMAEVLFPAYLFHIGALVHTGTPTIQGLMDESESTGRKSFDAAWVKPSYKRFPNEELKSFICPEEFVIHPAYSDDLYFENQNADTGTCGIHALNHFVGIPTFELKSMQGANMIAHFLAGQGEDIISRLGAVKTHLEVMKSDYTAAKEKIDNGKVSVNSNCRSTIERRLKIISQQLADVQQAIDAAQNIKDNADSIASGSVSAISYNEQAEKIIRGITGKDSLSFARDNWLLGQVDKDYQGPEPLAENILSGLHPEFLELKNGIDPSALMTVFEQQFGIKLHTESGPGHEVMNSSSQEDITPEKKALFEALQKNELPNNVDRAIIRDTTSGHFTCVRKLTNGQWICMDSNLSEPFPIPDNDLAKFIGNRGSYQIFYCKSSEDQKRFEDIISAK